MIGTRVETINCGWCEAISEIYEIAGKTTRGGWVDVKFDDTGGIKKCVIVDYFKQGYVRDSSVPIVIELGQIYHTKFSGDVEVVGGDKNLNIQIKFLNTGNVYKAQKNALLTGLVKDHPAVLDKLDKEIREKKERARVAKFKASIKRTAGVEKKLQTILRKEDKAQRQKEHQEYVSMSRLEKAEINAELIRSALELDNIVLDQTAHREGILNVDFKDREGNWVLRYRDPQTKQFVQTRLGRVHNNLTQRCNSNGYSQQLHNVHYIGVTLSEEFKNPNSFCDWAVEQVGWGFGYSLDKDLLVSGNKHYSRENCCFLPKTINSAIISKGKADVRKRNNYFLAMSSAYSKAVSLGKYETLEEAEQACFDFRQKRIARLAELYKENLDLRAYNKLMNLIDL